MLGKGWVTVKHSRQMTGAAWLLLAARNVEFDRLVLVQTQNE